MPSTSSSTPALRVSVVGRDNATISHAAEELAKYLQRATGRDVALTDSDVPDPAALSVALMERAPGAAVPDVPDSRMDDAILIDVAGETGVIAGNNARSVLLAVYRYLTELGCRWVRPGPDGECIPGIETLPDVHVEETPSYRHRAVCIEGAVSYEHVRDMVDWIPKLGFNGYFVQFREAHTFFDRWYAHVGNPNIDAQTLPAEKAREYTSALEGEIARRGLLYHKVGHGWTCEPFGISGLGWEQESQAPPPEVAQYFAEVKGEQKLWHGVALNTNLCYSNPEVRRIAVTAIAEYARENLHIDLLHFWLADGSNNNCECPGCREGRPSDFYVRMLNELDAALTGMGLDTKIVFLIYVDLLWPPEHETIENPERFVLMFAPITRTYSEAFQAKGDLPPLPPFERNALDFPSDVDANVAFLKGWQAQFDGDSFDFDYHLMWDHVNDPGHMQISQVLGKDMKALKNIGLGGYVSCQIQRVFFPSALPMTVMGRTLWDSGIAFDDIANDYFASAFGEDGVACREYLAKLSELFDPPFVRGERGATSEQNASSLSEVPGVIQAFMPVIERNLEVGDPCHAKSWFYLRHHAELTEVLAGALQAKAAGDPETARALWQDVAQLAWDKEPDLHPVFDAWLFARTMGGKFR